jgi:hypothetical protein
MTNRRVPKKPNERRTVHVIATVTEKEHDKLRKWVGSVSLSGVMREMLLKAMHESPEGPQREFLK